MENSIEVQYIDSHCHLQDYKGDELEQVLNSCHQKGLGIIYSNSTNDKDFEKTLEISSNKTNKNIKIIPGFGVHPWYLDEVINNVENWFENFKKYISSLKNQNIKFFIGEIGIDGGKIKKTFPLNEQIEIFKKQLAFANENNLLVHIHCVYEWDKLYKIMSTMDLNNLIQNKKIILHSFQGKIKHIDKFKLMNVYFSISSGCFTKSNYEMLAHLPNDQILLESDAPSMFNSEIYENQENYINFPKENTKIKNSPESVIYLCEKFASLKQIPKDEFKHIILNNSLKVYNEFIK